MSLGKTSPVTNTVANNYLMWMPIHKLNSVPLGRPGKK